MSDLSDPENNRTLGLDAFTYSRIGRVLYQTNDNPELKKRFFEQLKKFAEKKQEGDKKPNNKNTSVKSLIWTLVFAIALNVSASAQDIFIGRRGPTDWQLDQRVVITETPNSRNQTSSTLIKYWNGDEHGTWFMINIPYNTTIGDASIYLGPRGRCNNSHWFLYCGATLPTGPETMQQRTDINLGGFFTQMSQDQKSEIDGSLEYKITGINRAGINPADEFSGGLLYGRQLDKNNEWRLATGITYFGRENGDYSLNSRTVLRYTVCKNLHFEAMYTFPIQTNIVRTTNLGIFLRHNF